MQRYDLFSNPNQRMYLIDVVIKPNTIEAGWAWVAPGLQPIETLRTDSGVQIQIQIPENVRQVRCETSYYFSDEPVEFLRA